MFKRFKNKSKKERGASQTVEFLIIIIVLFLALTMVLDLGVYFASRNAYATAATSGARLAAIYGGASFTRIAVKYGDTEITPLCYQVGATEPVACAVVKNIDNSNMQIASHVTSVVCGPERTTQLGERVWCEVHWVHEGIPGSLFTGIVKNNVIRISAESEVVSKD